MTEGPGTFHDETVGPDAPDTEDDDVREYRPGDNDPHDLEEK